MVLTRLEESKPVRFLFLALQSIKADMNLDLEEGRVNDTVLLSDALCAL
jgi:hypothetical protein